MPASQPPPAHDPDEVRELAEEILARPEFGEEPVTLLERLADWIADLFDLPGPREGASTPGSGGSGLLTVLVLVALVVILVLVVRALLRQPRRGRSDADPEPSVEVEEHRSAQAWARAAADHEAAGRWKDGLRCRFRALLQELVDDGVVDDVPGRTTGELRAEVVVALPAGADDFDAIADLFDAAWYGDVPTGPDEARRAADHADAVLAAARTPLALAAAGPGGVGGS